MMNSEIDRRRLLSIGGSGISASFAAATLLSPERLFAAAPAADWTLGVADIDSDVPEGGMRRVSGTLPNGLTGTLFRNGPAKFHRPRGSSQHWFDGDGLMRRFAISDQGVRLTARFVDTAKRRTEGRIGAMVMPGFGTPQRPGAALTSADDANPANTSVMMVGGELWALWEGGSPTRIDPGTLATGGIKTLRDDLAHMPFLAHPRVDSAGRVWNLGQAGTKAIVWQLASTGQVARTDMIELPRASYIHDFTATDRHLVIVLQPWIVESDVLPTTAALAWRPEQGTLVMVLDKTDLSRRRTFELPAFSFFHLGDAWEESDGTIRFDGCVTKDPTFAKKGASDVLLGRYDGSMMPVLAMFALHADGRASMAPTRVMAEFPHADARLAGLPRRFTIHTGLFGTDRPIARGLGLYDWKTGLDESFDFGARQLVEEFLFVPGGSGERNGWLVGTTLNLDARATELHVVDAANVQAGPVATFRADVALPVGFHGTFAKA